MQHINPSIKKKLDEEHYSVKPLSYYVDGIKNQDYYILSESITLLESEKEAHKTLSLKILTQCFDACRSTFRVGVTGSPGVGKSTFIESIANSFVIDGHKVGILTVDPSSSVGKGSILGDKTRMEQLAKDKGIFIRPSPSNLHLGGLNQYTFEAIILCEAAGIDRIFVETVGVGQSEIEVSKYTDSTILLVLPGSGDSIQGIKKGIVEKADLIVIHKADGVTKKLAEVSSKEYGEALHLSEELSDVKVICYSSVTEDQKVVLIDAINKLVLTSKEIIEKNRNIQYQNWFKENIQEFLVQNLAHQLSNEAIQNKIQKLLQFQSPFSAFSIAKKQFGITLNFKEDSE